MPELQIQYARTSDGVSIAYTTTGEGPPVLYCAGHNVSMEYALSGTGQPGFWFPKLPAHTRLTIFDNAGIGASQRDVSDFSLDAQVRAIEAVAARLADEQFTLVGNASGSASASLYASRHPGRVRRLVCVNLAFPGMERIATEVRENWSLARRRLADFAFPEGPVSSQRWYGNAMRESMTSEVAAAYMDEFARADLNAIYRHIPVPTLLCIAKGAPARDASLALASVVPNCRVTTIPDAGNDLLAAILEFMGIDAAPGSPPPAAIGGARGTAVILFTDIADSTALTERMGDAAFRALSRTTDDRVRAAILDAGGTPVEGKVLGDGVMGVFASAADAIKAARACVEVGGELPMHIGLHAGDVTHEDGNVYGGAVNIASRVCGLCAPGEILVTDIVRGLARTSAGAAFEDRGEREMKGIGEPIRVFAVR